MTYHVRSFMAFKPDELGHDPNYGIVYLNGPILCTCVHIGMANKVYIGMFSFSMHKKINFHFLSVKIGFFCEGSTKNTLQNYTNLIFNNSRKHFMYISLFFVCMKLCINLSQKRQTLADSAESEVNLNYNYIIVCPCFFQKIIFRFTSKCFIIDP
jgi:hypothetical protein